MKISFYWQGVTGRYGHWKDGLYAAMNLIEKEHDVEYLEPGILPRIDTDVVLYWESCVTLKGKDREKYEFVLNLPYKKALLFAGGPVEASTCYGFDLFFVESKINEDEFEALGLPWKRAFGVNTQIFKPEKQPKVYDGFMQATYAGWKRPGLFSEALGAHGAWAGRRQEHEPQSYEIVHQNGSLALPELSPEAVNSMINASHCVVNTAEYWGGGQRCTLEAMAAGVPVIVMSDSPKNCEFVTEGAGIISNPNKESILMAIEEAKKPAGYGISHGESERNYVLSKWTERHYADALLEGIKSIM